MSILADIRDLLLTRRRTAAERYLALVEDVAGEKKIAAAAADAVLAAAGKAVEDLARDVGLVREQRALAQQIAAAPPHREELRRLSTERQAAYEEAGAAAAAVRQRLAELDARIGQAHSLLTEAQRAESRLRDVTRELQRSLGEDLAAEPALPR